VGRYKPVYAIVVNYNGWRDTVECVESLMHGDYDDVRIVVCDNGSSDGSIGRILAWAAGELPVLASRPGVPGSSAAPIAKPVRIDVVRADETSTIGKRLGWSGRRMLVIDCGANLGFAGANNAAMRFALVDADDAFVWLINNDTVVASDTLSALVQEAERNPPAGAVGGTILHYDEPDRVQTLGGGVVSTWSGMSRTIAANSPRAAERPTDPGMNFVTGCCALVSHDTLRRVGLLDERYFMYGEDADCGMRMTAAGLRLRLSPDAEIWHKGGASSAPGTPLHDYYNVKSTLQFVRKHRPALLPFSSLYLAGRFVLPKLVRRQWTRLAAVYDAYRDYARGEHGWRQNGSSAPRRLAPGARGE